MTKPQINVTPLIDVLLVLLIIFMVVTPMKPSAFEAKIPSEPKPDSGAHPPSLALVVVLNSSSLIRLNSENVGGTVDDLTPLILRLRSVFAQRTLNMPLAENVASGSTDGIERAVFIKAPRGIDYGRVAKVVDAVKLAGANPVSLQIDDLE